ncbi:MAG: hypothetical protein H0T15_08605, partial [Thermoleophilaceae bacterium]|nr:hypothetical protein [Thermoleophilaceae bacterium]
MPAEPNRSSRPQITPLWVAALAFIALLALAPGAFATTTVNNSGGSNLLLSGSENPDQVTATVVPNPLPVPPFPLDDGYDNRALKVEDPAGATAVPGPYCGPGPDANPNIAYCQLSQTAEFRLNGGNDSLRFSYSIAFTCGANAIELLDIYGDAGDDKILGSQCPETILGNAG